MSSTGGGIVPVHNSVVANGTSVIITVSSGDKFYPLALALHGLIEADNEPPAEKPGGTQPE